MEAERFERLKARIAGGLTAIQCLDLASVLNRSAQSGLAEVVIAQGEKMVAEDRTCRHCGHGDVVLHGKDEKGRQRFRCRRTDAGGCGKTFNGLTRTVLARMRKPDLWIAYARTMPVHLSVRKTAAKLGVSHVTAHRWRVRLLSVQTVQESATLKGVVEADETFFRTSYKGSRGWKRGHPPEDRLPRYRGGRALKPGLSGEQVPVLTAVDRADGVMDRVLRSRAGIVAAIEGKIEKGSVLCTDAWCPTPKSPVVLVPNTGASNRPREWKKPGLQFSWVRQSALEDGGSVMEWSIKLEARTGWGEVRTVEVGKIDRPSASLTDDLIGLSLDEAKGLLRELQKHIVQSQVDEQVTRARVCSDCLRTRRVRDRRTRILHTLFGTVKVSAPRLKLCACVDTTCFDGLSFSPLSKLLPDRCTPELRRIQAELGARHSFREAARLLAALLPCSPPNHASVRNRLHQVAGEIEAAERQLSAAPPSGADPPEIVVLIDGAHIRATPGDQSRHLDVTVGKVEVADRRPRRFGLSPKGARQQGNRIWLCWVTAGLAARWRTGFQEGGSARVRRHGRVRRVLCRCH